MNFKKLFSLAISLTIVSSNNLFVSSMDKEENLHSAMLDNDKDDVSLTVNNSSNHDGVQMAICDRNGNVSEISFNESNVENKQCPICLYSIKSTDPMFMFSCFDPRNPESYHFFHFNCAKKWISEVGKLTCPTCRREENEFYCAISKDVNQGNILKNNVNVINEMLGSNGHNNRRNRSYNSSSNRDCCCLGCVSLVLALSLMGY